MSYVLDALRRAEADRQRGQVPHLHASTTLGTSGGEALSTGQRVGPAGRVRLAAWALAAVGLLAGGVWWWGIAGEARVAHPDGPASAPAAVAAPGGAPDQTLPATVERVAPRPQPPLAAAPVGGPVPPPVALPVPTPRAPMPSPQSDTPSPPVAMPPMTFGGAFDSPDPKARMLIINGQVWREGDEPAPGWVLERIGLHEARFKAQGRAVDIRYDRSAGR